MNGPNGLYIPTPQEQQAMNMQFASFRAQMLIGAAAPLLAAWWSRPREAYESGNPDIDAMVNDSDELVNKALAKCGFRAAQ